MLRPYASLSPVIPTTAYVDVSAQVIGNVELGEHASVWMNAVLRGDVHSIRIGERSNVQDCAVLHGMKNLHPVVVGSGVTIGHNATVHGCTIADDVLIGIGAIALNGAVIGRESIVAAGALVPEGFVVPPRSLVAGLPGRVRRELTDSDIASIRQYARNYLDYKEEYMSQAASRPQMK